MIWLLNQISESRSSESLCVWGFPNCWNWGSTSLHCVLKGLVLSAFNETMGEHSSEWSAYNWNAGKTELENNIFIVLDKILNGQKDCIQGILDNILAEKAGSCYWDWVAINHSETLLENRILWFGWYDLFFVMISSQMGLEGWVNYKYWPKEMLSIWSSNWMLD
jgi:hypothetical protein